MKRGRCFQIRYWVDLHYSTRSAERIPFQFQIQYNPRSSRPTPEKADVRGLHRRRRRPLANTWLWTNNGQAEILMQPHQNDSCHYSARTGMLSSPLHSGTPPHGERPAGSLYVRIKKYVKHPYCMVSPSPITAFCFPAAGRALCHSMQAQNRRMVPPDPRDVQRDPSCS